MLLLISMDIHAWTCYGFPIQGFYTDSRFYQIYEDELYTQLCGSKVRLREVSFGQVSPWTNSGALIDFATKSGT